MPPTTISIDNTIRPHPEDTYTRPEPSRRVERRILGPLHIGILGTFLVVPLTPESVRANAHYEPSSYFSSPLTAPCSITEKLNNIRETFSLSKSSLARVLSVSRPTIYAWLEQDDPPLEEKNRFRIEQLNTIAKKWNSLKNQPIGSRVLSPLSDGRSLVDMLSTEKLNEVEIERTLKAISAYLAGQARSPFQTAAGDNLNTDLLQHGFEKPNSEVQNLNLEHTLRNR